MQNYQDKYCSICADHHSYVAAFTCSGGQSGKYITMAKHAGRHIPAGNVGGQNCKYNYYSIQAGYCIAAGHIGGKNCKYDYYSIGYLAAGHIGGQNCNEKRSL